MSYVKKNTTLVLFFLLLISIAFFSASVIFYQSTFTRLNDNIRDQNLQIKGLNAEITSFQKNISSLNEILDIQFRREENLSDQYILIKNQKEELESAKSELEGEVEELSEDLIDSELEIGSLNNEILLLNTSLGQVLSDIEEVCDDARSLNISECEEYT